MSLAELIAHFATAAYVEKLFRMVRREIQEGTDESYESAMSLVMILYSAHEVAEEKDLGVKNVVMKNDFMTRLLALFSDLRGRRQKAYEAGTKAAEKKRVQQLNEHAQRTAEGCDIRRAARDAQKEVEAFFDQPY